MASVKAITPAWVKRVGRAAVRAWGERTAGARMEPSFLLAGGQRCGTTSLHRALIAHPAVTGPRFHKQVNYFDLNYHRGAAWYRGHFPRRPTSGSPMHAMESSGYYLYHPLALPRIASDLPGVRVVVMLRDPVERTHSAYKHAVARGFETESFERALELEPERLAGEEVRLAGEPGYVSHAHRHWAYVSRGQYVEQVERLHAALGRERVHIVDAERFFAEPEASFAEVLEFLGLEPWRPDRFDVHNARPGGAMNEAVRQRLVDHFDPYDDRLERLLGRPLAWRRGL